MLWWLAVKKAASATWVWLKKYWQWLLLPVGVALYFLGRKQGGVKVIADREESDAARALKEKIEAKAAEEQEEAKAELLRKSKEVVERNQEVIEKLTDKQKQMADEMLDDPEALNSFLLDVGRKVRG